MKSPPQIHAEASLLQALAGPPQFPQDALSRDFQDVAVALLLGASPAAQAPADSWAGIQQSLAASARRDQQCRKIMAVLPWLGWAAAACLALAWRMHAPSAVNESLTQQHQHRPGSQAGGAASAGSHGQNASSPDSPPTTVGDDPDHGTAAGHGFERRLSGPIKDYQLMQSLDALRQEVRGLRAAQSERFTETPGLARIVVMEMNSSAGKSTTKNKDPLISSEKLSDIVAAGITGESDPAEKPPTPKPQPTPEKTPPSETPPEKKPILLKPGDTWNHEFVVPAGDPLPDFSLIGLPPGVSIRYGSLPLEDPAWSDNFHPLPDRPNEYYDDRNDVIWRPSTQHPGEFTGQRPGKEFNKDLYTFGDPPPTQDPGPSADTAAPQSGPGTVRDPVLAPEQPSVPVPTSLPPTAWTIFDESTGKGSIILDSLEPPPPGMSYQLSFTDALQHRDVPVGTLPDLADGRGRVFFDLGAPGYTPGSYTLTLRGTDTNSTIPVLTGPGTK